MHQIDSERNYPIPPKVMRLKWWRVLLIYKANNALIIIIEKSRLSQSDS